jgi:hypothetical protein
MSVTHHRQNPLECTETSVSDTSEMYPGGVSLLGHLVPSAYPLECPQLYQIVVPLTSFSSCGRERSRMEPVAIIKCLKSSSYKKIAKTAISLQELNFKHLMMTILGRNV